MYPCGLYFIKGINTRKREECISAIIIQSHKEVAHETHKYLPDNELCSLHCTVTPDLGIIAVVADDHADFHPLRTFTDDCSKITRSPTFNRRQFCLQIR